MLAFLVSLLIGTRTRRHTKATQRLMLEALAFVGLGVVDASEEV